MRGITLYTLFFNIRVYALRIYTHHLKKELWQAIIFYRIRSGSGSLNLKCALLWLTQIIVDFLNSIFSFFTEPGIFPDT
jgi:hypothetical protein